MNKRVLLVVLALVIVGGAAALLMTGGSAPKSVDTAASRPVEAPRPAPVAPAPPPPPPPAPAEPARAPEPRRRPAAPKPDAAPAPAPAPAVNLDLVTLKVDSDVPDAQVFVDRNFIGKTPLTTTDIKPGAHKLNVSAPGYDGVARDLTLTAGGSESVVVKLREVRLDASLDVVHKHRMGSCKGRLIATPQGLRYETSDKEDAFRATLMDLDSFEVDYLEKNLKIKPKGGKQFNFTDPEGNADHLFVFHRDVEKARARLKKGDTPATQD